MLVAVYLIGRVMFQFSTQSNFGWKAVGVALESSNCGITIVGCSGEPVSIDIPLSSSEVLLDRK